MKKAGGTEDTVFAMFFHMYFFQQLTRQKVQCFCLDFFISYLDMIFIFVEKNVLALSRSKRIVVLLVGCHNFVKKLPLQQLPTYISI